MKINTFLHRAADSAAAVRAVDRRPQVADQTADTDVLKACIISRTHNDVIDRRTFGQIHIARARQTADRTAAPAVLASGNQNFVAGDRTILNLCSIVIASCSKADQTTDAVPAITFGGNLDDIVPLGIQHDILQPRAGCDAEQTDHVYTCVNFQIFDRIGTAVIRTAEIRDIGLPIWIIPSCVEHTADWMERLPVFLAFVVQIVALFPIIVIFSRTLVLPADIDEIREIRILLVSTPNIPSLRCRYHRMRIVISCIPVDILQLHRRANLIRIVFASRRLGLLAERRTVLRFL